MDNGTTKNSNQTAPTPTAPIPKAPGNLATPSKLTPPQSSTPYEDQGCYPKNGIGPVINPSFPDSVKYTLVRFLNAAENFFPLLVTIGPRLITSKLRYKDITPYTKVISGYCTVIIAEAANPLNIVFRKSVSFVEGAQITLAIAASQNGLQLVEVSDQICSNKAWNTGCFRFVNLSYGSGSFDVSLENGDTVFSDIEYTEITPFKEIDAGNYTFHIFEVAPGLQPGNSFEPLLVIPVEVKGNEMFTIYLVGATYMAPGLQAEIITNT